MLNTYLYQKGKAGETTVSRARMLESLQEKEGVLWVDLEDPTEFESDTLVEIFNFHDLAVEDCLEDNPHPKVDDYEEYLFLVAHALQAGLDSPLRAIELDIFLGKNFVVTFHKEALKTISQIRELALRKPDLFFGHGPDRLVHAILDQLVDNYTPVLDEYDAKIESLEEVMFKDADSKVLTSLMEVKRDVFHLRRIIAPQRDMVNHLTRNPSVFIKSKHLMYYRDVHDHLFQIYGLVEGFHEVLNSILQVYFSSSSHKLNQMIQRMTILATLSMPTVMIASIYGMNFQQMPELGWRYGYFLSLGLMFLVSGGMLAVMKFKKWI
jgi:magnesium transporter